MSEHTIEELKAIAKEYDDAPEDAEWEPPHPIFMLAQENDNYKATIHETQAQLDAQRKINKELVEALKALLKDSKTLAKLASHETDCAWQDSLPTGMGTWGCSCGLDSIVLDNELLDEHKLDALIKKAETME